MKRKTTALMIALTLSVSLSACGDKTAVTTEPTDIESVEETVETTEATEEAEVTEEESIPESEPEITAEEKLQSAIGEMPYYGDTANCKMTAEQATAYAQLIADGLAGDFSFRGGYNKDDVDILTWGQPFQAYDIDMGKKVEVDRFNIMLGDFAGDGVPYLYLYSTNNRVDNQSYEIYGWADNTVKLVHDTDEDKNSWRFPFYLYEDGNNQCEIKIDCVGYYPPTIYYEVDTYVFSEGTIKETNKRVEELKEDGSWHITENGIESVYTQEEYDSLIAERGQENHTHTLPYTCFYDVTPCTLEEMVNYLNAYATAMSDGQSVPVEIKKVDIVKHDGTGITTKGEVPQEKVNSLEILRQYINGELLIASGNADSSMYIADGENFYFGLGDINNDDIQELLLSYRHGEEGPVQIHFPPSYECLMNVWGFDSTNNTYMVSQGSVCIDEVIYTYDGTSFSIVSSLEGEWDSSEDGSPYIVTENGTTREINKEEFWTIENDWSNRHTRISAKSADIHLDIENIENTFQVKIDVQSSGEWLVTSAE